MSPTDLAIISTVNSHYALIQIYPPKHLYVAINKYRFNLVLSSAWLKRDYSRRGQDQNYWVGLAVCCLA